MTWTEVSNENPCPCCGKGDWCARGDDDAIRCMREGDTPPGYRFVANDPEGGRVYLPVGDAAPARRSPASAKPTTIYPTPDAALSAYRMGEPSARWEYRDTGGAMVGVVGRWDKPDGKEIRPVSLNGQGWKCGAMEAPSPLYRPEALPDDGWIFVVEGERCADAMHGIGLPAVTSAGGCKAAKKSDWSMLKDRKVCILPDHDDPGGKYARDVADMLRGVAADVRIVRLSDRYSLPAGGDVADLTAECGDDPEKLDALRDVIVEMAGATDSIPALREGDARIQSGMFNPRPITTLTAPPEPDWLWEGYWGPGVLTLLSGHPKAGKSTVVHYLLHDLQHGGGLVDGPSDVRVAVLSEEPDGLWVERRERHGLDARLMIHPLRTMGRPSRDDWHRLIEEICRAVERGEVDAVVIDTLAAAWPVCEENDAGAVVDAMKSLRVLADSGCAVLGIHHTRKSGGDEGLSARGSSALAGAVDVVMDLRRHNPQANTDPTRIIRAWSRYTSTPSEVCVRLGPDGYEVVGDVRAVDEAELVERLANVLPSDAPGMTAEELHKKLGEGAPGVKKIRGVLDSNAQRMGWNIEKESNRNGGWRFWKGA